MNIDVLNKYKEDKSVLQGRIRSASINEDTNEMKVLVDLETITVTIKAEEFDVIDRKNSMHKYVGTNIEFVITEIIDERNVLASRKILKEAERDAVIKALEEGQEMDAKVVYLQTFGAYLEIDGTQVVLRNTDFAQDHTRVIDNHKVNDIIKVKISKISNTKKIFVQAVEKFCADTVMDFSKFNRGDIVFGTIKNIKSTHCYVCIAPDLDALTSVPEVFTVEPTEGMRVVIRITKIIEEEKRVRGKIISFIEETNDFNL